MPFLMPVFTVRVHTIPVNTACLDGLCSRLVRDTYLCSPMNTARQPSPSTQHTRHGWHDTRVHGPCQIRDPVDQYVVVRMTLVRFDYYNAHIVVNTVSVYQSLLTLAGSRWNC